MTPTVTGLSVGQQSDCPADSNGKIECQWNVSYTLDPVPTGWTSGIYLARLTGKPSLKQSYIIFVVRDDSSRSDIVFESSVTTYQAYNYWPDRVDGFNLYKWGNDAGIPANRVS